MKAIKYFLFLIQFSLLFGHLNAAISFDASSTAKAKEKTSLTFAHTCSGTDRILVVGIASKNGTVDGITYNGVALTKLRGITSSSIRTEMWYLVAPATGSHNIVVSMNSTRTFAVGANSYTGVDQTTPFLSSATANGNSGTSSVTIASVAGNLVVDALGTKEANPTVGAGQTQRTELESDEQNFHSTSDEPGAASVTMSYTHSNKPWIIIAGDMQPVLGPLPVTLMDFNLKQLENKVRISWLTAAEINNDYFELERSRDGIYFETVDRIVGNGNSNRELSYTYYDFNPKRGISYYRLVQYDFDGTRKLYEPKVIEIKLGLQLEVYPNPTRDFITVEWDELDDAEIVIANYEGSIYKRIQVNNSHENASLRLDVQSLPKGLYRLIMKSGVNLEEKTFVKF